MVRKIDCNLQLFLTGAYLPELPRKADLEIPLIVRLNETKYDKKRELTRWQKERERFMIQTDYLGALTKDIVPWITIRHVFDILPMIGIVTKYEYLARTISQLEARDEILSIELSTPIRLLLNQTKPLIGIPQTRNELQRGSRINHLRNIRVGLVDSGIDNTHPDLRTVNLEVDTVLGDNGFDQINHGTPVAGIIVADGTLQGIAPEVVLHSVKAFTQTYASDLYGKLNVKQSIEKCWQRQDDVINVSVGFDPCFGICNLCQEVSKAINDDTLVVAAAGNNPSSLIQDPAQARDAIAVGTSDKRDLMWPNSPLGPAVNGQQKPDVVAPGVNINSISTGGGYLSYTGSSVATPHVTAAVALLLAKKDSKSVLLVKQAILNTTKRLSSYPMNVKGHGRIEVERAYNSY